MNQTDSIPILNLTIDQYLDIIGSYKVFDILYMFVSSSLTAFLSILCLLSIWIFFKKDFNDSFYIYYRILSINSFIHELLAIGYSLCFSPRLVPYEYQYNCINYQFIFLPIHIFFHNYSTLIEIGILLDRLKIFSKTIKKCVKLKQKTISIILFLISLLIGTGGGFIYSPGEIVWYNQEIDDNSTIVYERKSFYFLSPSEFSSSPFGSIFIVAYSLIINIPVLIVLVFLNFTLIYYVKKHLKKYKIQFNNQRVSHIETETSKIIKHKEKLKRKTSLMANVICSITIISRTIIAIGLISSNANVSSIGLAFLSLGDLFVFLEGGTLFFVCFSFNKIFKKHVLIFFKINEKN